VTGFDRGVFDLSHAGEIERAILAITVGDDLAVFIQLARGFGGPIPAEQAAGDAH